MADLPAAAESMAPDPLPRVPDDTLEWLRGRGHDDLARALAHLKRLVAEREAGTAKSWQVCQMAEWSAFVLGEAEKTERWRNLATFRSQLDKWHAIRRVIDACRYHCPDRPEIGDVE